MTVGLAIAAGLLILPLCAYRIAPDWPHELRDRALLTAGWLAGGLALWSEPGLGILYLCAVRRWRDAPSASGPLMLGLACLIYGAVKWTSADPQHAIRAAIVAGAIGQTLWAAFDLVYFGVYRFKLRSFHAIRELARGSMGNRVIVAAYLAIAAPLAPPWALSLLIGGLAITTSYVGMTAAIIGLAIAHPRWAPALFIAALIAAPGLYWLRGHPRDSWNERTHVWRLSLAMLYAGSWSQRLFGFGHGSFAWFGRYWTARKWTGQCFRQAHNDLVHLAVEYGLVGVAAVLLWGLNVSRGTFLGDPWTGALVAALVVMMGQFPSYLPQTSMAVLCIVAVLARRVVG